MSLVLPYLPRCLTQPLYTVSFQCTFCELFDRMCACSQRMSSSVIMRFLTSPKFCYSRFGWNSKKTEETLQPVLKQLGTQQVKTSYSTDCIYISLYKYVQCCWSISPLLTTKCNENHQSQNRNTFFTSTLLCDGCTNTCLAPCPCCGGEHASYYRLISAGYSQ